MARSRVGGSSAKLSGVLGSLVFSIGKDAVGNYEQYIATYNPDKANPNTKLQALARMQIAMIERMVHLLTPIIRSSFESKAVGVESVNYFAQLNMKSIQDYCKKYWKYALNWSFPTKGNPFNAWAPLVVSYGSLRSPKALSVSVGRWPEYVRTYIVQLPGSSHRVVDLRKALNLTRKGSLNVVCLVGTYTEFNTGCMLAKWRIADGASDTLVITNDNVSRIFVPETKIWDIDNAVALGVATSVRYDEPTNQVIFQCTPQEKGAYQWLNLDTFLHAVIMSDYRKNRWVKSSAMLEPVKVWSLDEEYGRAPYEAFYSWFDGYDGEEYDEFFGK